MKYAIWLAFVILCSIIQSMLNNYLPVYLSPDILLMLVAYVVFFYSYYAALASIIVISYAASLFSAGSIWFYIFSYLSVFYVLIFLKKFFDRSQGAAIVTIAAFGTLFYPLVVLILSILSNRSVLFNAAVFTALQQVPANMAFAYLLFKYLPSVSQKLKAGLVNQKV
jgi:hypothetical protein